ncbi:DUF5133 domain-containing protein [Streptomyces sp. NPDC058308]|uniref:DUF5133 domain-containing protein n=1 Tax=Streptomyces sp. NPDC058308 TaxID=3346440 RepID=UPI0036E34E34
MLRPDPAILDALLNTYSTLRAQQVAEDSPEIRRRLDDVSYTLCVSTGTRTVEAAVAAATAQLSATDRDEMPGLAA